MTTRPQAELARTQELKRRIANRGADTPTTNHFHVTWRDERKSWRVKVHKLGVEFYKEFKDEHVAGWVADCAALMMLGPEARDMLNFCWTKDNPPRCPDPSITPLIVYQWLADRNIPVLVKPSGL